MNNYKDRLLDEFEQIIVKIVRLDMYIFELKNRDKTEQESSQFTIMNKQLEHMNAYADCLKQRISLIMNDKNDVMINNDGAEEM